MTILRVQLTHPLPHKPYCCIAPTDAMKKRIYDLSGQHAPNAVSSFVRRTNWELTGDTDLQDIVKRVPRHGQ